LNRSFEEQSEKMERLQDGEKGRMFLWGSLAGLLAVACVFLSVSSQAEPGANKMAPRERISGQNHLTASPRDLAVFLQKMR
jgi:hypothetical protein